jgi:hypothetical protein
MQARRRTVRVACHVWVDSPCTQGLPTGDKALYAKDRVCRKVVGSELKETCRTACEEVRPWA